MIDIAGAKLVEIQIDNDGQVVWINVDGVCQLRVSKPEHVIVMDDRENENE